MRNGLGLIVLVMGVLLTGCSRPVGTNSISPATAKAPPRANSSKPTVDQVREIVSQQMNVAIDKVTPATSLGDLGADDLDLVELVMELEDHFSINIPDEKTDPFINSNDSQPGLKALTIQKLVAIVDELKASSAKKPVDK